MVTSSNSYDQMSKGILSGGVKCMGCENFAVIAYYLENDTSSGVARL